MQNVVQKIAHIYYIFNYFFMTKMFCKAHLMVK